MASLPREDKGRVVIMQIDQIGHIVISYDTGLNKNGSVKFYKENSGQCEEVQNMSSSESESRPH